LIERPARPLESRAVAEEPHDADVKFDMYQIFLD